MEAVINDKQHESAEDQNAIQKHVGIALDKLYDVAIGKGPSGKSCKEVAEEYTAHNEDTLKAAKKYLRNCKAVCAGTGFVTNLGGLITLPAAIPANIGTVLYAQMRMIVVIASMGGYDVNDHAVQTLVYLCLIGSSAAEVVKEAGVQVANKAAMNLVKKIPGKTLQKINQMVEMRLITKFGTTGVINLGKLVPVAGGVIGGAVDYFGTRTIGKQAIKMFIIDNPETSNGD